MHRLRGVTSGEQERLQRAPKAQGTSSRSWTSWPPAGARGRYCPPMVVACGTWAVRAAVQRGAAREVVAAALLLPRAGVHAV